MKFEMDAEVDGTLDARVEDVAQEAIDSTATTYAKSADIDVEQLLRTELSSRGIKAANNGWISEVAHQIRSGHHVRVGEPDGSVEGRHDDTD